MTKHTHGPWDIGLNPTIPEGQQIEAYSEDGNRVLQVIVRTFNPDDLHLIAAAPELLRVCIQAVTELEDCCATPSDDWDFYEKLKAAIAKAEGQA